MLLLLLVVVRLLTMLLLLLLQWPLLLLLLVKFGGGRGLLAGEGRHRELLLHRWQMHLGGGGGQVEAAKQHCRIGAGEKAPVGGK